MNEAYSISASIVNSEFPSVDSHDWEPFDQSSFDKTRAPADPQQSPNMTSLETDEGRIEGHGKVGHEKETIHIRKILHKDERVDCYPYLSNQISWYDWERVTVSENTIYTGISTVTPVVEDYSHLNYKMTSSSAVSSDHEDTTHGTDFHTFGRYKFFWKYNHYTDSNQNEKSKAASDNRRQQKMLICVIAAMVVILLVVAVVVPLAVKINAETEREMHYSSSDEGIDGNHPRNSSDSENTTYVANAVAGNTGNESTTVELTGYTGKGDTTSEIKPILSTNNEENSSTSGKIEISPSLQLTYPPTLLTPESQTSLPEVANSPTNMVSSSNVPSKLSFDISVPTLTNVNQSHPFTFHPSVSTTSAPSLTFSSESDTGSLSETTSSVASNPESTDTAATNPSFSPTKKSLDGSDGSLGNSAENSKPAITEYTPTFTSKQPSSLPTMFTESCLTIELQSDGNGHETSWALTTISSNADTGMVANHVVAFVEENTYTTYQKDSRTLCLPNGTYEFTLRDELGDDFCCHDFNGNYSISLDGREIIRGRHYGAEVSHEIRIGYSPLMTERESMWLEAHNIRRMEWHRTNRVSYIPLVWSSGLAKNALQWAQKLINSCQDNGIQHEPGVETGENLAKSRASSAYGIGRLQPPDHILQRWVDDEAEMEYPSNGHLTQVLWRASKYVGCGDAFKEYDDGSVCRIQVCKYAKAGNCNMGDFNSTEGDNYLIPMLMDDSPCPPMCPPEGCH